MKSRALALPTISLQLVALILGLVCFFAVSVPRVQAAQLTEPQVQAILNLLTSFDVDSETVGAVEAALRAPQGAVLGTSTIPLANNTRLKVFSPAAVTIGSVYDVSWRHESGPTLEELVAAFPNATGEIIAYNNNFSLGVAQTIAKSVSPRRLVYGSYLWRVGSTTNDGRVMPAGTYTIILHVLVPTSSTTSAGIAQGNSSNFQLRTGETPASPPGQTNPVIIESFEASSLSVQQGKKVTFSWKSNLTSKDIKTYGAFCAIEGRTNDNRALQVTFKNKASGAVSYKPEATAKYMLICSSGAKDGSPVARAELAVEVVPLKPSCTIKTNKGAVNVGERFTLSWKSANATIITGLPGYIDSMPLQGSQSFALSAPGIQPYTLTATGPGGTATCEVNITGKGEFNTAPASSTAPSGAQSSLLLDAAALAASAVMSAATSPFEMAVDSLTNLFVYAGVWQ